MTTPSFILRDVESSDGNAYVQMLCSPVMMSELGGPLPPEEVAPKVARDVASVRAGEAWVLMIVPAGGSNVAGSVVVWTNTDHGVPQSEIGWMVLPDHQGRGLAKAAVREVLARARRQRRWGPIHAYPGVTNGPSNGICSSLGFTFLGEEATEFAGQQFVANHWVVDLHGT